ncbi:MAG: amino acid adenylation domain-containing protein [Ectothiorhodospiraceae bacterium]|nr:amino acid adenylation domain-containing protein [Ectothiorhodospiraceae bacterium]
MSARDLLARLRRAGIRIWAAGADLGFDAPVGAMTPDLRDEVRSAKPELLALLVSEGGAPAPAPAAPPPVLRPMPRDTRAPLSDAQRRLWLLSRVRPGGTEYNLVRVLRLRGPLDPVALERALVALAERHEALRTTFVAVDGEPMQHIAARPTLALERIELAGLAPAERAARVESLAAEAYATPFDLERGPLARARLARLDRAEHVLVLAMHHLVYDGWSVGVLLRDLGHLYRRERGASVEPLASLAVHYADYAVWQREMLSGPRIERGLDYWRQTLAELPTVDLRPDRPRPSVPDHAGAAVSARLEPALWERIGALARRTGTTAFMVLLAALACVLRRHTRDDTVVVGTPVANRPDRALEPLVGFFVNMLTLRTVVSPGSSFEAVLSAVRDVVLGAWEHQEVPFERLVEDLEIARDTSRNPLFQIVLALQSDELEGVDFGDLAIEIPVLAVRTTRFDLELHVTPRAGGGGADARLVYATALFERARMQRLLDHLVRLTEAATRAPGTAVADLDMLDPAERGRVLTEWNRTERDFPRHSTVPALLARRAEAMPDAPAVVGADGHRLTFRALDARAREVSDLLGRLGVGPGAVVAVLLERTPEMVAAWLGVMQVGAAYLPLDPALPEGRLDGLLAAAAPAAIVAAPGGHSSVMARRFPVLVVAPGAASVLGAPAAATAAGSVPGELDPECAAYVVYTSGSSGEPKGVAVSHRALQNLATWHRRHHRVGPRDRVSQLASVGFDACVWEVWPNLLAGASVHLADDATRLDPARLWRWLAERQITLAFLPTPLAEAALRQPLPRNLALRALLTGGDRLHGNLPPGLPFPVVNHYGPTECAVVATCWEVDPAEPGAPPIGRPIDNVRAYVLDDAQRPVPIGAVGELFLGGESLANGYHRRPDLTALAFVVSTLPETGGRLLYRTGDLVRYRDDGALEFVGRVDDQVSVRGQRIEPAEVEAVLDSDPAVAESVVGVRAAGADADEDARLVAWVVPSAAWLAGERPAALEAHTRAWHGLYQQTYAGGVAESGVPEDLVGWRSSYTGEPIPEHEMRDWVRRTVERIAGLAPRRVLEIGCGTGLLLERLAPGCERYVATDFSPAALARVQGLRTRRADLAHVELREEAATGTPVGEPRSFDTVVLNSVAQYLPDGDTLRAVVLAAVDAVADGGRVFVGDLRSLPLQEAFHASVQAARARPEIGAGALAARVRRRVALDRELCVDPLLFHAIAADCPRVGDVELRLKRGDDDNELTRFRYDAILHVGPRAEPLDESGWPEWTGQGLDLDRLRAMLAAHPEILGVRGVPDARVAADLALAAALRRVAVTDDSLATLRRAAEASARAAVHPRAVQALADAAGYDVELAPGAGTPGTFDLVLRRRGDARSSVFWSRPPVARDGRPLTNDPIALALTTRLAAAVRAHARERLPAAMVPAAVVMLRALPLSAHGKVDRAALPEPLPIRLLESEAAAPEGDLETTIAAVWCDVLGLDSVGRRDSFFDLGGHSLLVPRLQARLERALGCEIPTVALFQHPTVEALAARLATAGGTRATTSTDQTAVRAAPTPARQPGAVAIVGMAVRLPGASDPDAFWDLLCRGGEGIRRLDRQTLLAAGVPAAVVDAPGYVPAKAILDDADCFDAEFFGLPPAQAAAMDPQHRVLLELAWEALERAGHEPAGFAGDIGIWVGASAGVGPAAGVDAPSAAIADPRHDLLATRIAYALDLRGPAIGVQTACSTSLVAVHLACRALLDGDCDLALAGGVAIKTPSLRGYRHEAGDVLSPDGHCRPFDAAAAGTVPGEGAALVVLRRLDDALADGDTIEAVVLGTAVNNDGADKIGFTAPAVEGQARVIATAQARAGVTPSEVRYVEAHGTGTALGDPIEVAALGQVLGPTPPAPSAPRWLGAVKSNLGHLDAAAGVVGLVKAALAARHGEVPPTLHFRSPNPALDLDAAGLRVPTAVERFAPGPGGRRVAGVSAFGIGGTNAHVVLAEPPLPTSAAAEPAGPQVLVLSARTEAALGVAAARLAAYLADHPELALADVAHTLRRGRRAFEWRLAIECADTPDAVARLRAAAGDPCSAGARRAAASGDPGPALRAGDGAARAVARWLDGADVDWGAVDAGRRCRRVALPGYPFERRRFAVPAHERRADRATAGMSTGGESGGRIADVGRWFHVPGWRRDAPSPATRQPLLERAVIVGGAGTRDATARRLRAVGVAVTEVDEIGALPGGGRPAVVIDLRLADRPPLATADAAADALARILTLVRAVDRCARDDGDAASVRLVVATRGALDVVGGDQVDPLGAVAHGVARVVGQELAHLPCTAVDLDPRRDADGAAEAEILAEVATGAPAPPLIAVRGGRRWRPDHEAVVLGAVAPSAPPLRTRGVYLVTGGLGRVGLALAGHLARSVAARLVLLGRAPAPPAADWPALARAGEGRQAELARTLSALVEAGAQVMTVAADVSDAAALRAAVEAAETRFGRLDGVVHAAGCTDPTTFAAVTELDLSACRAQLRPKLGGLLTLDVVLGERALDFRVTTSSLSAVLGGPRLGAYAAANTGLDALVEASQHGTIAGAAWRAVDWDAWRFPDRAGVGVQGELYLSPEEGADAFARALRAIAIPRLVLSTGALAPRLARWGGGTTAVGAGGVSGTEATGTRQPRPAAAAAYVAPVGPVAEAIAEVWADMLGIEHIGADDDFYALGGESLLATRMASRLRAVLAAEVSVDDILEASTVGTLAARLAARTSPRHLLGRRLQAMPAAARAEALARLREPPR